ncbi:hypothetical protein Ndes2526B_g05736 [Nannochloris sp. 'desiccata']
MRLYSSYTSPGLLARRMLLAFCELLSLPLNGALRLMTSCVLNVSQEGCRYLVSHDDYSLTSLLPENTLVVTQLRDPVTRVLSAYEFAIEVAARRIKMDDEKFFKTAKNMTFVNTLNVWPWSHLVPWFRKSMQVHLADLNAQAKEEGARARTWTEHFDNRRNRTYYWNKELNQSVWKLPPASKMVHPYSNVLVTPLFDWIETKEAQDLIHEGATLQILGLTNYSHWKSATALRKCFFEDLDSHRRLVDVAKQRLRSMLHVGLTENLDQSVASMAAGLGFNLSSHSHRSANRNYFAYDAPGFDMEQVITFNASRYVPTGEMTPITIREARHLLVKYQQEADALNKKLGTLEPELQELVDKEDAWLEEEDNKKKEEGQGGSTSRELGTASVLDGIVGWVKKSVAVLPTWPPKVVATTTSRTSSSMKESDDGVSDTDLDNDDDDEDEESVDSGTSSPSTGGEEEDEEGEGPEEGDNEGDLPSGEKIDSPWAEEIEALDAKVYDLQQKRDAIKRDIDTLLAMPLVKGPPMPQGPAKLLVPDSEFEDKKTSLGAFYRHCSKSATKKAADKRRGAFKDLVTPWHESFGFSSAQRKALHPTIVQRIRELNAADLEIWELGKQLLEEALVEQAADKTLQELPPPVEAEDEKNVTTTKPASGSSSSVRSTPKPKHATAQAGRDEL